MAPCAASSLLCSSTHSLLVSVPSSGWLLEGMGPGQHPYLPPLWGAWRAGSPAFSTPIFLPRGITWIPPQDLPVSPWASPFSSLSLFLCPKIQEILLEVPKDLATVFSGPNGARGWEDQVWLQGPLSLSPVC